MSSYFINASASPSSSVLGKPVSPDSNEFPENFRKGGGRHFRSKKFHCNFFCIRNGNFGNEFAEKIAMKFSEKGAGGVKGRSEIFRKFIRIRGDRLPLILHAKVE